MSLLEFDSLISQLKVSRTILNIQQHNTFVPNYSNFKGNNHFDLQRAMKNHHVNQNGWSNIGQHFTVFPDGSIMTGRSLELSPACILGNNSNSVCIENLGNFDQNGDIMSLAQKITIISITAALCKKFSVPVSTDRIVYHHWFNLSNGNRNNGTSNNKSCPGVNFFGGNKVIDAQLHFLPEINKVISTPVLPPQLLKFVMVTASTLNIRTNASVSSPKAVNREKAAFGAVLRVYEEKDGWYKISHSEMHWVSSRFTIDVKKASVKANTLNVRNGPGVQYQKVATLMKNEEIFVTDAKNNWSKIGLDFHWVSDLYLDF